MTPRAMIIAGPNGAGKTTFAKEYLLHEGTCTTFINADLIAAGLSPFRPEEAAVRAIRLMAEEMHRCVSARRDFSIETTLAGRAYMSLIRDWRMQGYHVKLIFLRLTTVDLAVDRVRYRVIQGGHDVPEAIIRRRFEQGWKNFQGIYRLLVDAWQVYDSSGETPLLIDEGRNQSGELG
jgi:predicted ABC-type ATPase